MKIRNNKDFTKNCQIETVKNAIANFKEHFTENDLVRIYEDTFGEISFHLDRRVVETTVSAFPSNDWSDSVSFQVDMLVGVSIFEYHELHFYVDFTKGCYTVAEDEVLHSHLVFALKRDAE